MAVAKGNVVDADELIAHIKSIVNTFCDGATNSGVGRVWSGQSTGIQWTGTKTDVDNSINEAIEQFKLTQREGELIKADAVYNLIKGCFTGACRTYRQTYSYYQNVGYTNTKSWPPVVSGGIHRGYNADPLTTESDME